MHEVMKGVRVLEVAQYSYVPTAGAVLADWGADVLKVEHPTRGDAQRGLVRVGGTENTAAINFLMEHANRGKRSVAIDIKHPDGRDLIYELAKTSDVFLTNFLPDAREKLQIDVEHIRAHNDKIVYVRGSAFGNKGPERRRGGYDATGFWARSGAAMTAYAGEQMPPAQPGAAFGDSIGGMTIAGGISAALFARERTGVAPVVDVSLLSTGVWAIGASLTAAMLSGQEWVGGGAGVMNPLVGAYRTKDGGFIMLVMLEGHYWWADTCEHLGRPELVTDPRFESAEKFAAHSAEAVEEIRQAFAQKTTLEWRDALAGMGGQWAPFQTTLQVASDPQVLANDYTREVDAGDGSTFRVAANPVQFDETPADIRKGPEHAQHTEEVLLELGLEWERIAELKQSGAVG